jgi:uncharacterized membrane protein
MITVTLPALTDMAWHLNDYDTEAVAPVPILVLVLSVVIAGLMSVGTMFGGPVVYQYGSNVETAGYHPVGHKAEQDVFPGSHN